MPVTLESRTRRMQVFHLPHDVVCGMRCACAEVTVVVVAEHPRTGERTPQRVSKRVPDSLTILARERKAGLPSVVLDVPDVKAAIARGYLRVVEQTPDHPPAPATVPAPPANSATTSSPRAAPPAAPPAAMPAPGTVAPAAPAAVPPAKPPGAGA